MKKKMRIGVDIRDLKTATTGQKTYLEELVRAFLKLPDPNNQFLFLDTRLPVYTGNNRILKILEHINLHFWKQITLPIKAWTNHCDVLLCTDYFVPFIRIHFKTFVVFHDAFFLETPEHYNKYFILFFKYFALPSGRRCTKIIVPTNYAAKKIHSLTGIPLSKLATIYIGPKLIENKNLDEALVLNKYHLETSKYILHVGIINKRKNIPLLINAFALLSKEQKGFKLVLAGIRNASRHINNSLVINETIQKNNLAESIVFTGYLNDEELAVIYKNALLYVFPSFNEGFGIPILEAFTYHLPVAVANNTCLPEIGGDAVLTFDPYNVQEIYNSMNQIITNKDIREKLIEKGEKRLQSFSWEKTATEFMHIFNAE